MADYSVGNLFLDISAIENGSVKTLSTVTRRLNSLYKSVDNFSKLDTSKSIGKITSFFDTLGTTLSNVSASSVSNLSSISRSISTLQKSLYGLTETNTVLASKSIGVIFDRIALSVDKVDTAKIERLASVTKALSSLKNVSNKITNIDFDKASKGFQQLATAIDPFIEKVKSAETALGSLDSVLKKTNLKTVSNFFGGKSSGGGGNNLAKSLNLAGVVGKLYFIRNYTKQLGQSISKIVQMGMDFTETLNLWTVAMGNNIASAEEFISKMNKAYGIAEETLMRYQATFRNMLSTLGGISPDTSYALSEYIMQMALDYASLYNTSIEKAMTVFQAVLSGQVRPIRSISGYDITETTIYELYQQLGGTKTMRQLTQTEKRLLRIYAVFQQMERSEAIGDLKKTLGSTANTTRVLSETLKNLGTYIGILLDNYLAPLLTKVTAFALTVTNIVKVLAKPIIDKKKEELGDYGLTWEETTDDINGASEAYDEFTGKLLGFDKFRSLSSSEEETNVGIDEKLLEGLMQYQSVLEGVTSDAEELAKKWTALFIDDTGNFTDKAKELYSTLQDIATVLAIIGGIKVFSDMATTVSFIATGITTIKDSFSLMSLAKSAGLSLGATATGVGGVSTGVLGLSKVFTALISPLGIVLGLLTILYSTNENFRESVNNLFLTLWDIVKSIVEPFIPAGKEIISILGELLTSIAEALVPIVKSINDIIIALMPIVTNIIVPLIEFLLPHLVGFIREVASVVTVIINIISALLQPVLDLVLHSINFMVKLFSGDLKGAFEEFKNGLSSIGEFWGVIWQGILWVFEKIVNNMISGFESFVNFFIKGINLLIKGINSISFKVPDWVPAIGGKTVGFNLKLIEELSLGRVNFSKFAEGGMPDKGTLFVAGEAGAEMVYNTPSGQSGVANVQQIAQASYSGTKQALVDWWKSAQSDIPAFREVSKTGIYEVVDGEARRRGRVLGTV